MDDKVGDLMIGILRLHNTVSQHQRESQMSPSIKTINASNNNSGNNGSKTSYFTFCSIRLIDDLLLSNFKLGTSLKPIPGNVGSVPIVLGSSIPTPTVLKQYQLKKMIH